MAPKTKKTPVVPIPDDDYSNDEEIVVAKPKITKAKTETPAQPVAQPTPQPATQPQPDTQFTEQRKPVAPTSPGEVMIKDITIKDLPYLFDRLETLGREMLNPALTDSVKALREYLGGGKPMDLQQLNTQQPQRNDAITPRTFQGSSNNYRGGRGGSFRARGGYNDRGGYRGRGGPVQTSYCDEVID